MEVKIHERGRLVAREHRAHHALIQEVEESVTRHARLLGKHRDLAQVLHHHAQHDVVADLRDARQLAVAHIARASAEHVEKRPGVFVGPFRPGGDNGELAGLDHLGVAADRRSKVFDAFLLQHRAQLSRAVERDGRAFDHHAGFRLPGKELRHHLLDVVPGGDHAEDDVAAREVGKRIDDLRAVFPQRLGLGARAVPDGDVAVAFCEAGGHFESHAAGADPAELQFSKGWQSGVPLQGKAR